MSSAITKQNYETLEAKLKESKDKIGHLLAGTVNPDKFVRNVLLAVAQNPRLLHCSVQSVYMSAMQAADLGLMVSGVRGEAYLVPYQNRNKGTLEAQLQIGYRGLLKLAYRTFRDGIMISAELVYAGDEFSYMPADPTIPIKHVVNLQAERKREDIIGAYMIAWIKGWQRPFVTFMTRKEIDRIRDIAVRRSPNAELWTEYYEEACRKTVLRRGLKYLPVEIFPQGDLVLQATAIDEEPLEFTESIVDITSEPEQPEGKPSNELIEAIKKRRRRMTEESQQKASEPKPPVIEVATEDHVADSSLKEESVSLFTVTEEEQPDGGKMLDELWALIKERVGGTFADMVWGKIIAEAGIVPPATPEKVSGKAAERLSRALDKLKTTHRDGDPLSYLNLIVSSMNV